MKEVLLLLPLESSKVSQNTNSLELGLALTGLLIPAATIATLGVSRWKAKVKVVLEALN